MPTAFFFKYHSAIMNIVLIGYRCSGKTHVGKLLARELNMTFWDTDTLVEEKWGMQIPAFVAQNGWADFRRVEREVVEAVALTDNSVIATGGGAVMDSENVTKLKRSGWLVWLDADPAVIRERMARAQQQGEPRPPLSGSNPLEEIDTMLHERRHVYEGASDYRILTDGLTPESVKESIIRVLPDLNRGGERRTS